jgi:hypothetical protein
MRLLPPALLALCALCSPAAADPRDVLRDCQALLARAEKAAPADKPSDAEVARCRLVVHDWSMRDARMLVDENGKPLR